LDSDFGKIQRPSQWRVRAGFSPTSQTP
jgi:hypothetical protein